MRKKIVVLGSTGSIGVNTLKVITANPDKFELIGLTAGNNIELLKSQIKTFRPKIAAIGNEKYSEELKRGVGNLNVECCVGAEGIIKIASLPEADLVVSAIVGAAGLIPTYEAVKRGKDIALANKETLVAAGELIFREAKKSGSRILPVDSEHSAIFQALRGEERESIRRLIITASGGPFYKLSLKELENVTLPDALKHPTWQMGEKITIDSATLMNKGFEVIEARWLFGVSEDQIEVVIHPQSIIHSLVEFVDGSIIAQLGIPDMRIPISFALNYPKRRPSYLPSLNLTRTGQLTFESPNLEKFNCLKLAFEAIKTGGTMPAVLNAANEVAVSAFLKEDISFLEIPRVIAEALKRHAGEPLKDLTAGLKADKWARKEAKKIIAALS